MSLPPLANLFAARDPDPIALEALAADLATSGEFTEVWRPAPGWVAAAAPLPYGPADGDTARPHGLAFAEGGDVVGRPHAAVAEMTDVAPECLASLRGDFGFIRFRPDGGATVVRSCGGLVPFYLWRSDSRVAVSTRLGDFVRFLPDEPRLDPLVNAVWAAGRGLFPERRTFLAGVSILERGCFVRVELGRAGKTGQYWDPRPTRLERLTPAREREHADRLRWLLVAKLERDLDPEGGNLLTLSGGVDSSSLAALAAGVLGRKVWTWSFLPEPEDLYRHEMSYIEPLAEQYGFERRWEVRFRAETRLEQLRTGPHVVFHVIHPALCDLPRVLSEAPVRVLFGGEFADEVCGSVLRLRDWMAHTSLAGLVRTLHKLPTGARDVWRWLRHRALLMTRQLPSQFPASLPGFVRKEIREEYRAWLKHRRREVAVDNRPLSGLALCAEEDGFVPMNWETASTLGVRRSFPFFNREVLELAFECHPAELLGPGTKRLLRCALRDNVPVANLQRADKGGWGRYLRRAELPWAGQLPLALQAVVSKEWYSNKVKSVDLSVGRAMTQLARFVESLDWRRQALGRTGSWYASAPAVRAFSAAGE